MSYFCHIYYCTKKKEENQKELSKRLLTYGFWHSFGISYEESMIERRSNGKPYYIGNENEIVSGADIYKKIKTSMDRLEDSYEKILKEVDNTLKKKDFNPRSKNQRVVQFLVSNLGKLSPMKGVEYFGNISTSYKGILDVFNIKELVDEEFENLMRYGKDR